MQQETILYERTIFHENVVLLTMVCQVNSFRMIFALHLMLSTAISQQTNNKAKAYQAGDVILGGLFPVHSYCPNSCHGRCGDLRSYDMVYFTQAMIYAIDETNNSSKFLPGISLGFEILDYCSKDVIALEEASHFLPSCLKPLSQSSPIAGVVGPYSSSVALQVSNLLGLFKVPHISYGATSPLLSDKKRFKYFVRTVPSDQVRARALADLLLNNGTRYVSVIYSDDEFGREGSKFFTQEAENRGICIGATRGLPQGDTVSTFDEIVKAISEKLNAKVIVLFCSKTDISLLFDAVKRLGKQRFFRWLVGGDSAEMSVYLNGNEGMADHMVLCSPQNEKATNFEKWKNTRNNVIRNPWISEIKPQKNLSKHRTENSFDLVSDQKGEAYIQSVINSVYTFVNALDGIYKSYCKNDSKPISCLQNKSQDRKLMLEMIHSINFETPNGRKIAFDENGDISAEYDLLKPQRDELGRWGHVKLGRWGPVINGSGASMVKLFKHMHILPRTSCSLPCEPGEIKIPTKACCWSCNLCKTNEITRRQQTECFPCNQGFMVR